MGQTEPDFAYGPSGTFGSVTLFASDSALVHEMMEDAVTAGLAVTGTYALAEFGEAALADIAFIEAREADAETLALLTQFDLEAASRGTRVVVLTTLAALDGVFGCLSSADAEILVRPSRGERIIALARTAGGAGNRVHDLSDVDRLALERLAEQVADMARKLDRIEAPASAFRFESPESGFRGDDGSEGLIRKARPPLPDPALVRKIIRHRQARAKFFDSALFADPAWDMLLDLTAARAEHTRVSVTSLCIASGVPPTTALRWISQMVDAGLLQRIEDEEDRRRAFIALTDHAAEAMARYFAEVGKDGGRLV